MTNEPSWTGASRNGTRLRRILPALATIVAACGGTHSAKSGGTGGEAFIVPAGAELVADHRVELARYRQVETPAPAVDSKALLDAALAGTVAKPGSDLGSRMERRKLSIPTTPTSGTARFNFAGTRRGWVATPHKRDVLPTPAFHAGNIFISGGFGSRRFVALDAYTGEHDWVLNAEDGGPSAAIVDDGLVVFNAESCKIFVADAKTGKLLWKKWLGDPLMSVPVSAEGVVMTAFPTGGAHAFVGLELRTGKELWRLPVPNDIIRVPQVHGDSVYFATMDGTAFRVRRRDGKKLWSSKVGATSAMWVEGDRVLLTRRVGGKGGAGEQPIALARETGVLVHKGERRAAPYLGGKSRDRLLVHRQAGAWGNVRDGGHLGLHNVAAGWAFQGSSPVVADGRSYLAIAGDIVARDIASGRELWRRTYKEVGDAQAVTPPAVVGSQLVFGTVDGHLYFADIDTGMAIRSYDIGEPVISQPIVAQGWVYLTTAKGRVVGLELADPMFDGWHMWGGNASHTGLVANAAAIDPHLLASRERPGRGSLRADAASGAELPLIRSQVRTQISGTVARVELTQIFTNPGKKPIEAVYLFPLPDDAAVDDMEMRIGERVVRAQIKEKKEAKKTYAVAKAKGKRAALLEQQRPDLFTQRVANIGPGDQIVVALRYVHEVPSDSAVYEYRFPMVAKERAGDEVKASEVGLAVTLDAGLPIAELVSPSHEIESQISGDRASLELRDSRGDRDFVLRYRLGGAAPTAALHAHPEGEQGGYFGLTIQPPLAPKPEHIGRRDLFVAVDTSGSMRGRALAQARAIASRAIAGLGAGDRFNLYWGSDRLAAEALPATATNIERAARALATIEAGTATTAMPTIEAALAGSLAAKSSRARIVTAITDGFIGNEADVIRTVAAGLGDARFYPVGVGASANRFLLDRTAELGGGRAMVADLSDEPAAVAARFHAAIDRPVFTDVEIDWGGLEVSEIYPRRIPDLFADRALVVRGRFASGGKTIVKIRGTVAGVRYQRDLEVALPAETGEGNGAQATLWARAAIRDRMNRLYLRDDPTLIREVKDLGLRHRLVTQWTSFVAVENDEPKAARVPTPKPRVTVTPATALPGDPEIRVPAPRDARAVTIVLPFGETLAASYDDELELWTARFLIPSDARDGSYRIDVITTLASGVQRMNRAWYEVDSSAAKVRIEAVGEPRAGARITLRATQTLTAADRRRANGRQLTAARIQLLSDARRVRARGPSGAVLNFSVAEPGVWEASYDVPADARGTLAFDIVVADLAANIGTQRFELEVVP